MTAVRLSEDGPQRFVAGGEVFEPGDVRDVSEGLSETLLEKPFFETVDADTDADGATEDVPRDASGDTETETEDIAAEARETTAEGVRTEQVGDEEAPPADQGAAERETDTVAERDTQTSQERDAETVTSEDVDLTPEADADEQQSDAESQDQDVDADVDLDVDSDDELAEMTHDELKALAVRQGIADEIDLRSKQSIIDALEEEVEE